jgi:hypothetical protein
VKKRSQTKATLGGASVWIKRKPAKGKTAAKKFKGVRVEKKAAKKKTVRR